MDPGDPLDLVALRVLVEQDGLARLDEVVELVGRPARELVDDPNMTEVPNGYCPNHATGVKLPDDFVVTPLQYVD